MWFCCFSHLYGMLVILNLAYSMDIQKGKELFETKQYKECLAYFLDHSKEIGPEGYYYLGQIYREGLGIEADEKKGTEYFQQAANLGYAPAQYQLGGSF